MASRETFKAIIKKTGEEIQVYKLNNPAPTPEHKWNRFLGEKINMTAIEQKKHEETYTSEELNFIN